MLCLAGIVAIHCMLIFGREQFVASLKAFPGAPGISLWVGSGWYGFSSIHPAPQVTKKDSHPAVPYDNKQSTAITTLCLYRTARILEVSIRPEQQPHFVEPHRPEPHCKGLKSTNPRRIEPLGTGKLLIKESTP